MKSYRAENQNGHAVHFLKRLSRASDDAAALALHLYHDPELLRASLSGIRIPDSLDRAALSLSEEDNGPYLVVSRNGRFITCLGEGMSLHGLHPVPFTQLMAHMKRRETLRQRVRAAPSLVGESEGATKLLARLRQRADDFSKEELLTLSALQPAMQAHFLAWAFKSFNTARDLSRQLHRKKRVGPGEERALKLYWSYFYASAHLLVLSGMNSVEPLVSVLKQHSTNFVLSLSILLRSGRPYMAFRLAWFIGKIGKVLLPECKRLLAEPKVPEAWLLGLLGALVIGLRHSKTAKEVERAVLSTFRKFQEHPADVIDWMIQCSKESVSLLTASGTALLFPEETHADYLAGVKSVFVDVARDNGFAPPYAPQTVDETPDDLALAFSASIQDNFRPDPKLIVLMIIATPWLARCEAEDLYLPKAFLEAIHSPWNPEPARRLLEDERERLGTAMPIVVEKPPGRNDPCACGSGLKYKKCCGKS